MQVLTFLAILGMGFLPAIFASETPESATSAPSSASAVIGDILMEDFEDKKRDWKFEGSSFRAMAEVTIGVRAEGIMDRFAWLVIEDRKLSRVGGHMVEIFDKQTGLATSTLSSWSVNSCVSYFLEVTILGGPVSTLFVDGKVLASATGQNSTFLNLLLLTLCSSRQGGAS